MKVTLDTNSLHQEGYSSQNMQVLSRLSNAGEVDILVSDLVLGEYDSKRILETESKFQSVLDTFLEVKKLLAKSGVDVEIVEGLEEKVREAKPQVLRSISESSDVWKKSARVRVVELSPAGMSKVWVNYFNGDGAFRKPKHRDDIPDAAISQCILEAFNPEDGLAVICRDGQLKRYLGGVSDLTLCDELSEFIARDEVQGALRRLDSLDANVEAVKEVLQGEAFQSSVMEYISQEKSDLYYACWKDEEVENCHWLPLPLAGGIRADGPVIESISSVSFGSVSCIAPKHFVIPLEFNAKVPVSFAAIYFDWVHLPQNQKDKYYFDSMDGDGVCDFSVLMPARVLGQVVVCLLEDMTPALVEAHAGFIGHNNCHLDIEYVAGKVALMREDP